MKLYTTALMLATAAIMASCENDDTDYSDIIAQQEAVKEAISSMPSMDFDYSSLSEPTETIPTDDNDYLENWTLETTVTITYSNSGVTISGDQGDATITSDGCHVTARIKKRNICFRLTGESSDGSLKVYGDKRFMISLDGLSLQNPQGAAINSQCGKTLYLVLADGSENTLSDGETYQTTGSEDMKGCLFSEGQIVISGNGSLDITAIGKNAIASDDYIVTRPGIKLSISASAGNGMKANDGIFIRGGVLNILASGNGYKGINSESGIDISGGRTIVQTTGQTRVENGDSTATAALKCDSLFTMTAGILRAKSEGNGAKGINTNMSAQLHGGDIAVATYGQKDSSSPRAIKADDSIQIANASVVAYSEYVSPLNAGTAISYDSGYSVLFNTDNFFKIGY